MDEQTPHLHVTVVPIVTTERKKKASEANAKRRYRTKSGNAPRLSDDSIMTRDNLTAFQDSYAEAMKQFGLERGIHGSEARHVDQHEYYRKCQIEKKGLEEDVVRLSAEKKKVGKEKKALEAKKAELTQENNLLVGKNELYSQANERIKTETEGLQKEKSRMTEENASLAEKNSSLAAENKSLASENVVLTSEKKSLQADTEKLVADRASYSVQTEAAKQEAEAALKEADEVMAERDAIRASQRKELASNIGNLFTGSKTKRLEAEVSERDKKIEYLEMVLNSEKNTNAREMSNLRDSNRRMEEQHESYKRGFEAQMARIEKYFPNVPLLLPAIRDCEAVGLSERNIKTLLDCKPRDFNKSQTLYDPDREKNVDVGGSTVQIKQDPLDGGKFRLHINGKIIFQWFKELWQSLKQTVGIKFKP